ncbi:hypothetical protein DBP15_09640 [Streptomyces sp. CS065A]|nr:hypothetical protein DBP15_09640 [Streptomyces sp. CS065A]
MRAVLRQLEGLGLLVGSKVTDSDFLVVRLPSACRPRPTEPSRPAWTAFPPPPAPAVAFTEPPASLTFSAAGTLVAVPLTVPLADAQPGQVPTVHTAAPAGAATTNMVHTTRQLQLLEGILRLG